MLEEWFTLKEKKPEKEGLYLVEGFTPDFLCAREKITMPCKWGKNKFSLQNEFQCKMAVRRWKDIGLNEI